MDEMSKEIVLSPEIQNVWPCAFCFISICKRCHASHSDLCSWISTELTAQQDSGSPFTGEQTRVCMIRKEKADCTIFGYGGNKDLQEKCHFRKKKHKLCLSSDVNGKHMPSIITQISINP